MTKGYWETKSGREIKISDMTDTHLINTIKYLKKISPAKKNIEIRQGYDGLMSVQGEMAEVALEDGINQLENMSDEEYLETDESYNQLIKEAKKRKLI